MISFHHKHHTPQPSFLRDTNLRSKRLESQFSLLSLLSHFIKRRRHKPEGKEKKYAFSNSRTQDAATLTPSHNTLERGHTENRSALCVKCHCILDGYFFPPLNSSNGPTPSAASVLPLFSLHQASRTYDLLSEAARSDRGVWKGTSSPSSLSAIEELSVNAFPLVI